MASIYLDEEIFEAMVGVVHEVDDILRTDGCETELGDGRRVATVLAQPLRIDRQEDGVCMPVQKHQVSIRC